MCLQKIAHIDNAYVNNQRGTFYTGLTTGCLRQKHYKECVKYAKEALADKKTGKVLEAMMHLRLGESYLFLGQTLKAVKEVQKYLYILQTTDVNDKNIMEQISVFLAGDAFSQNSQQIAYAILICCDLEEGKTDALRTYYEKLAWSKPVVYTMEGIEKFLVNAIWSLPYEPIFAQIIIDAFNKRNLREAFCKTILLREQIEMTSFQETVYMLGYTMQRIMAGTKEDVIDYHCNLQRYIKAVCQWYDFLEAKRLIEQFGNEMPGYIQAAMDIGEYIEIESQDKIKALGKLKNAVEHFGEFADGIGEFLQSYAELEIQRIEQQRNEMDELRVQVIGQVKGMVSTGQKEAAKQIIRQLKQMFPDNVEIEELEANMNA